MTRAGVWYGARDVRVVDVELPATGPADATIAVAHCGICGSDLHEYADGPHAIPMTEPHPESGATAPIILGHEFCGTVIDVGSTCPGSRRATGSRWSHTTAAAPVPDAMPVSTTSAGTSASPV